jgi:hypothetical protein
VKEASRNSTMVRADELTEAGVPATKALQIAHREHMLDVWRKQDGMWLSAYVYGDFIPPISEIAYPELGIRLTSFNSDTVPEGPVGAIHAHVDVDEKNLSSIVDAHHRLSNLLGILSVQSLGNGGLRFRTIFSQPDVGGFCHLTDDRVPLAATRLQTLKPKVRKRVSLALYWFRVARPLLTSSHSGDALRVFDGTWNALELLVEAVCDVRPVPRTPRADVEQRLNAKIASAQGVMTIELLDEMRREVAVGFPQRARHALRACFGDEGNYYSHILFDTVKHRISLYRLRNELKHGSRHHHDPDQHSEIPEAMHQLWLIVMRLFAVFLGTFNPLDVDAKRYVHGKEWMPPT